MDELFGWAAPRLDQYSMSRAYFSWLQGKNKEYVLDARVNRKKLALKYAQPSQQNDNQNHRHHAKHDWFPRIGDTNF